MSDPGDKDVLDKADALLRRHAGGGDDPGSVPILTDLVEPSSLPPDEHTADLAHEVFERVIVEVEGRLAADLERRLAQHLSTQVHAAVASALGDLRRELAGAIADAVNEAIKARQVK